MARTISTAHRLSSASWGISLFRDRICLNVGRGAMVQVEDGVVLIVVTQRLLKNLPKESHDLLQFNRDYAYVEDVYEGSLEQQSFVKLSVFEPAHSDLVERAVQNRKFCFWPHAHSPSMVAVLREEGFDVPDPEYRLPAVQEPAALADVDEQDWFGIEGRRKLKLHLVIERDRQLARKKKESVLGLKGRLECQVCGFDFERVYGSIGHGFAEVHHLLPLKDLRSERKAKLTDLAIVCSNCHRVIHLSNPVLEIDELKRRMKDSIG